jgi:hypothetical protein
MVTARDPRRRTSRTTTKWALAMFVTLFFTGSIILGLILEILRSRVTWTGGWPVPVLASIVAAWGVALLAVVQLWDLVQTGRYRRPLEIEYPDEHLLSSWLGFLLPPLLAAGGFVVGKLFWG